MDAVWSTVEKIFNAIFFFLVVALLGGLFVTFQILWWVGEGLCFLGSKSQYMKQEFYVWAGKLKEAFKSFGGE